MGQASRRLAVLAAIVAVASLLVAGCSPTPTALPPSGPPPVASSSSLLQPHPEPTQTAESAPSAAVVRNDLARPLSRRLTAEPLSIMVSYSTSLPVGRWRPEVVKPVRVTLTVVNPRKRDQKIYLTRVTATVTARDEFEPVEPSKSIEDTSNLTPGYIVTAPNAYGQVINIPAVDLAATSITLDLIYEFVLQIGSESRDYAKQTASDTLVVPLS